MVSFYDGPVVSPSNLCKPLKVALWSEEVEIREWEICEVPPQCWHWDSHWVRSRAVQPSWVGLKTQTLNRSKRLEIYPGVGLERRGYRKIQRSLLLKRR